MDWLKQGAAVLTSVTIAIGGLAVTAWFIYEGIVTADVGVPIIAGGIVGATGFLWAKAQGQATADAYQQGLRTPVPVEDDPSEP